MTCYSSYIVGGFTLALVIFDMVQNNWDDTWKHALVGTALTSVFWLLCLFLGDGISFGILVIPTLFFLVFALGILMTGESLKRQGCCVKCTLLEDTITQPSCSPEEDVTAKPICEFNPQLKATPLL
jgi:hypothetical protein